MAITTLDGVVAGFQLPEPIYKTGTTAEAIGLAHSTWYQNGRPSAGAAPAPGINGASLSAPVAGQIAHTDPGSGNAYLGRLAITGSLACTVLLCDRLWHNSGLSVTSTTAQAITPATLPARDLNGSTNGEGVLAAIEWSAAGGAGTPTVTLTYTDQDGNTGATGTFSGVTTPNAGTFEIFTLASGDSGVRAPTSFIQSATRTSGTMHLILFRIIASLGCPAAGVASAIDALTSGMPRIYDGSVPFIVVIPSNTTAVNLTGTYTETHG